MKNVVNHFRQPFQNLRLIFFLFLISLFWISCFEDPYFRYGRVEKIVRDYKTKNVIVVVVDGQRFSEGWGDSTHQNIPKMAKEMASFGVINTQFYNKGDTYTSSGHTSLTTGVYQSIDNSGEELPANPSVFQYWNEEYGNPRIKSWVITSKDKLAVLADCNDPEWKGLFTPSVNSGVDGLGLGSGYREDSLTLKTVLQILNDHHPNLVLINFRDPDYSAHSGSWDRYLTGIKKTDEYVYRLWKYLQTDKVYRNTTTLFVTNDHGRHLDEVADGFASHGDGCEGCRHLNFFALGPDFENDDILSVQRELIDVPVTIAELLGFSLEKSKGQVMWELFRRR
jgi:hypothetical protein